MKKTKNHLIRKLGLMIIYLFTIMLFITITPKNTNAMDQNKVHRGDNISSSGHLEWSVCPGIAVNNTLLLSGTYANLETMFNMANSTNGGFNTAYATTNINASRNMAAKKIYYYMGNYTTITDGYNQLKPFARSSYGSRLLLLTLYKVQAKSQYFTTVIANEEGEPASVQLFIECFDTNGNLKSEWDKFYSSNAKQYVNGNTTPYMMMILT